MVSSRWVGVALVLLFGLGLSSFAGGGRPGPAVAPQPDYGSDRSLERGPAGVGPVVRRGRLGAQLTAHPAVVDQGANVGIELRNRGSVALGYGYGERIQRRAGGRWVPANDVYHRRFSAWIMPLIVLAPGRARGPDMGPNMSMQVVLRPDVPPGLYRVVKDVIPARGHRPGRRALRAPVRFRVEARPGPAPPFRQLSSNVGVRRTGEAAARLWLDRKVARPGERIVLAVENLGETALGFEPGGRIMRWKGGWWRRVPDRIGRGDHTAGRPGEIRIGPGELSGAGDGPVDRVLLPRKLAPGLYAIAKQVTASPARRRDAAGLGIDAWFRVTR